MRIAVDVLPSWAGEFTPAALLEICTRLAEVRIHEGGDIPTDLHDLVSSCDSELVPSSRSPSR